MRPDETIQWRSYPALLLAGCVAAGIAAAAACPEIGFWAWAGGVAGGLLLAFAGRLFFRGRLVSPAPLVGTLMTALVACALGGARYAAHQALPARHLARWASADAAETVLLEGHVVSEPVPRASGLRFLLAARRLVIRTDTLLTTGRVQITLAQSAWGPPTVYRTPPPGAPIRLRGRLRAPTRRRNPADVDYGGYLRGRGVYATLTVYDAADVAYPDAPPAPMARAVGTLQQRLRGRLNRFVPSATGRAVLHALILGDRGALEPAVRAHFTRTGLAHVLAVSGLHVLLVGMLFYRLLQPLLLRLRAGWQAAEIIRATLTMAALTLYLLVAGASASVVRAVTMAGLFIGGTVLQRTSHPLNTLGVAAVGLLLARPTHLFEAGFQLSFAAVAALVTVTPVLQARLPGAWLDRPLLRAGVGSAVTSLAATLGTAPVVLYHFGRVSLAGLLLNVPAIPLTVLTLAAGLATVLAGSASAAAARVLGAAADALARGLVETAAGGDAAAGWAAVTWRPNAWHLAALVAGAGALAQGPRPRLRWRLILTALCCAAAGVWTTTAARTGLDVVFFDVGHGDAALVSTPGGRRLLIDAGPRDDLTDRGGRTLLAHTERFGIGRIDAVLITHPHSDHAGGLSTVLRTIPVGRVLHNGQSYASALLDETMDVLDSLSVPHRALRAGDTIHVDPAVLVQVLAPDSASAAGNDANEASVVVRLVYGRTTFLFTGDAEAEAEERMVRRYAPLLVSDVVKVGHHGSRTSSTPAFVTRAAPDTNRSRVAVVSVGPPGKYGLPDEDVIRRWHDRHASVWSTNRRGALWLRSDGSRVTAVPWR